MLTTLTDRRLAEIDRDAEGLVFPSPDEIHRMVSEIRRSRPLVDALIASQGELAAALESVHAASGAALKAQASRA